jgi:hypothetical protein
VIHGRRFTAKDAKDAKNGTSFFAPFSSFAVKNPAGE